MVARGDIMTQAQMDDLADLANTKMPAGAVGYVQLSDPFEFAYIDNDLEPPANLIGSLVYTGVSSGAVDSWYLVRVYTYKDVGGRRHYSGQYAQAGCRIVSADMVTEAHVHWTWDAVTGADGYIIVFTDLSWNTSELGGYPTGNIVFPLWNEVIATEEYDQDDNTTWSDQPPCGYGAWPRMISWIHFWAVGGYTDAGAYDADVANYPLVSGPWVVSIGDVLRITQGYYSDIEYWFPSDGDPITVEHVVEIANKISPWCQVDSSAVSNLVSNLKIKSADGGTLRIYVRWRQTGSATGWSHSVSITTGTATITSETWTEIDNQNLELYAEIELTAAVDQVITFDVTAPDGTVMAHYFPGGVAGTGLIFDESLWSDTDSGIMFWGDVLFDHRDMTPVLADAIHPTQNTYKVTAVEEPDYGFYTFQGIVFMSDGGAGYGHHDDGPVLKASVPGGVWVAKTKPVFAEHTFLDIDLPSYNWVRTLTEYKIAGFGETSMSRGYSDPTSRDGRTTYSRVENPVANGAAVYPVLRDTDTAPAWLYQTDYFYGGEGFVDRPLEPYTYQVMPGQNSTMVFGEDFVICTVPQAGYCVFRITVRTRASAAGVVPTVSSDTDVKVGTFLAGVFVEYETLTILSGESEASMDVFWPVLEVNGSFVGWQSDTSVDVFAQVNFMPQMISDFFPDYDRQTADPQGFLYGDFCGFPYRKFSDDLGIPVIPRAVLRDGNKTNSTWASGYRDAMTVFQPSATIYNDTEAMLNLMP